MGMWCFYSCTKFTIKYESFTLIKATLHSNCLIKGSLELNRGKSHSYFLICSFLSSFSFSLLDLWFFFPYLMMAVLIGLSSNVEDDGEWSFDEKVTLCQVSFHFSYFTFSFLLFWFCFFSFCLTVLCLFCLVFYFQNLRQTKWACKLSECDSFFDAKSIFTVIGFQFFYWKYVNLVCFFNSPSWLFNLSSFLFFPF
jgi:hypothetical protein